SLEPHRRSAREFKFPHRLLEARLLAHEDLAGACHGVVRADRSAVRKGAVPASAPQTSARPRYSVSSKGPMALTVLSYVIAATSALVLPASSVHHAQTSPRRNAVTAMTLPMRPNNAL